MNFYKTSFMIMVVVLIICLAFLGSAISASSADKRFPPVISECPDYYELDSSGICSTSFSLYTGTGSECNYIKFSNSSDFPNYGNGGLGESSELCEKKIWAENCGVNWDGITTNENICYA